LSTTPPDQTPDPRPNSDGRARPPGIYFDTIAISYRYVTDEWLTWGLAGLLVTIGAVLGYLWLGWIAGTLALGEVTTLVPVLTPRILTVLFMTSSVYWFFITGMLGGLMEMALRQLKGEEIRPSMVLLGFRNPFNGFVALFVSLVLVTAGFTLLFPGFYLIGALAFAPYLSSLRGVEALDALRLSFLALWRHGLGMFALIVLAAVICFLGLFTCGIGLFLAIPMVAFMVALHYTYFFPTATGDYLFQPITETPPS
jgi:hypothetical protein